MTKTEQVNALHNKAMDLAGRAFHADVSSDFSTAESLFREAFEAEREAALLLADEAEAEPTRSVLLRSAATLGVDCREFREAERLVALGLSGNPPTELCDELRDVLETVYFSRHLSLRGLELDPLEFQMSLTGTAIGLGVVESGQFLRRAESLEKLLVRTTERLRHILFRESGGPSKETRERFGVFYSIPRAASFAITIRLGRPQRQLRLSFEDSIQPKDVIEEFVTCIGHFSSGEADVLHQRIDDDAYFNNFTGLARTLAPDGEKVKTVGFTSIRGEEKREVALTGPAGEVWRRKPDTSKTAQLVGTVRSADESTRRRGHPVFGVEDNAGKTQNVVVPPGLLQDIVRPYWGERVKVLVQKRGGRLEMVEIEGADGAEPPVEVG